MTKRMPRRARKRLAGLKHPERKIDTTAEARLGQRITPQPNGCWLHLTGENTTVSAHGRPCRLAHWVYETMVGPIPTGCSVVRTCSTTGCVNPAHRELR